MAEDILIGDTPKAIKRRPRVKRLQADRRLWKHSRLSDIDGLSGIGPLAEYFIFTIVRNPWDRMVSYYHWLQDQTFDHRAVTIAKSHGFSDFLNHRETLSMLHAERYGAYVEDRQGNEVQTTFLRLETLAEDLLGLEKHLGFKLDIPHVNASERDRDWRGYYSAADAELVQRCYSEDIARFGYGFDPE